MIGEYISLAAFIILVSLFLYINRKKVQLQKVAFPLLYVILFRSKVGLKFMDWAAQRFRGLLKTIGYCFIGFSFAGIIFIMYTIIATMINYFKAPATSSTGISLVLPLTNVPGIGYLSFWYWIISLFILVIVHEFGHGILMRVHNVRVKSSGFGFLGILVPIVPLAFVEQDEKQMDKREGVIQHSILAAGPMTNIVLAILIMVILPFTSPFSTQTLAPGEGRMTIPVGFSVDALPGLPAANANITNGTIINAVDGVPVTDAQSFSERMFYCSVPNTTVVLGSAEKNYTILTTANPVNDARGYLGVVNIKNERRYKPEYKGWEGPMTWFKGLFRFIAALNFLIGMANFIPVFITDGAHMLRTALTDSIADKKLAIKIWSGINIFFVALLVVGLIANLF